MDIVYILWLYYWYSEYYVFYFLGTFTSIESMSDLFALLFIYSFIHFHRGTIENIFFCDKHYLQYKCCRFNLLENWEERRGEERRGEEKGWGFCWQAQLSTEEFIDLIAGIGL